MSVLVPVYGVEKYIERCARSLFEQTMQDGIEFIFTDDCSPDNSITVLERVLEEYPKRKSQVKILRHKVNKGLAVARTTGLSAARGRYVMHCDSDDWAEQNMCQTMLDAALANDAEIIACDYYEEYPVHTYATHQQFTLPKKDLVTSMILHDGKCYGFLWNKMIRRDFYLGGAECFCPSTISVGEDIAITVPMMTRVERFAGVNHPLYHYNCTNVSMTSKIDKHLVQSGILTYNHIRHCMLEVCPEWDEALNKRTSDYADYLIRRVECYNPVLWRNEFYEMTKTMHRSFRNSIHYFLCKYKFNRTNLLSIRMEKILGNALKCAGVRSRKY